MIGKTLSHFRILSLIGEGGMGVVYRAQDENLQRTVALKVLPPERLDDEERRLRFIREARTAASVTHPNIATVHEVGESEGAVFIAMELIEGRTLREVLGGESLPPREALRLAVEIGEGLAAAHRAHVIHRDLKPENVIVTSDGRVKILDFGLAKLLEERDVSEAAEGSKLATISEEMTRAGRVMGTAAYMSPEQTRGLPVDARSDVFSFGVVLYEMVTGEPPFRGATPMDTLTAILREQPVPPAQFALETPLELDRIIRKCLEKDPAERYQDTRDLVVDLRHLKRDSDSQPMRKAEVSAPMVPGVSRRGPWKSVGAIAAVAVVLAGLAMGSWYLARRGQGAGGTAAGFQSMKMTSLARIDGLVNAALSPDGRFLAYIARKSGRHSLAIRQVSTGSDVQILPPQEATAWGITFSPDGEYLYFLTMDPARIYSTLYRVPALGGTPRKILFDVDSPVTFSPDGKRIAFLRGQFAETPSRSSLMVAGSDGSGEKVFAAKLRPEVFEAFNLSWSPDGQRITAVVRDLSQAGPAAIVEFALENGRESRIGGKRWDLIQTFNWLPDGSGIALIGAGPGEPLPQIWLVTYPDGTTRRITNDLNSYVGLSVSADARTLATVQVTSAGDLWMAAADDSSAARQITSGEGGAHLPYLGPGGGASGIAATPSGSIVFGPPCGRAYQILSSATDGTGRRRLTPDGMDAVCPLVARVTGTIVFTASGADQIPHVFRMDPDGGNLTQLTHGEGEFAFAVSPDGKRILYRGPGESAWEISPAGSASARTDVPPANLGPIYSPDGRTLWRAVIKPGTSYVLDEIPAGGGAPLRSVEWPEACDYRLPWKLAPSGDALTCIGEVDGIYNLWNQPLSEGEAQTITRFKSGHVLDFDWSPDGERLFLWRGDATTDVVLITGFR